MNVTLVTESSVKRPRQREGITVNQNPGQNDGIAFFVVHPFLVRIKGLVSCATLVLEATRSALFPSSR